MVHYRETVSPDSNQVIAPPPQGAWAAVTDQTLPGYAILYQDLFLEPGYTHTLTFKLYYVNRHTAFVTPADLTTDSVYNQQYRVDIIRPTASILSVSAADVLANLFQTRVGDPLRWGQLNHRQSYAVRRHHCSFPFAAASNSSFQRSVDDVALYSVPNDSPPVARRADDGVCDRELRSQCTR
jgi:hypothetical protein